MDGENPRHVGREKVEIFHALTMSNGSLTAFSYELADLDPCPAVRDRQLFRESMQNHLLRDPEIIRVLPCNLNGLG
jgi:hypothetical protein